MVRGDYGHSAQFAVEPFVSNSGLLTSDLPTPSPASHPPPSTESVPGLLKPAGRGTGCFFLCLCVTIS